jgi:hypothetical protein
MIRQAEPPDLPTVLALLADAKLPTDGVAPRASPTAAALPELALLQHACPSSSSVDAIVPARDDLR